ncbi:hypothetical protein SAMN05216548_103136 [Faunimonas pinastri]|uniref:N-terminal of MaoC-like dehydratase domain-containing protein n=1 Tax=Faunimonas pinastri TaxID=1855383 RepID=A0A1H9ECC1_9HYPH|nr:hypothetical protein [Faunimonas pinastri]SEQ23394.1 hypothetical protein SAMN05216548_103136 [Faunimonas pinastri]
MTVGRYVSDLEEGDVLGPVEYTISRFVIREYAHAVELHEDCFQHKDGQIAPPTMVHLDKLRLYKSACPEGTGPHARVHIEYDATVHAPVPAEERLSVKGIVSQRYVKRGRDYVHMEIEMRAAETDKLLITYRDTVILSYGGENEKAGG